MSTTNTPAVLYFGGLEWRPVGPANRADNVPKEEKTPPTNKVQKEGKKKEEETPRAREPAVVISLQQIAALCLPHPSAIRRCLSPYGLRPERLESATSTQAEPIENWTQALQQLHACVLREGGFQQASKKFGGARMLEAAATPAAAILYDQAYGGGTSEEGTAAPKLSLKTYSRSTFPVMKSWVRQMLEIDYGLPPTPVKEWPSYGLKFHGFCESLVWFVVQCKQGRFPDRKACGAVAFSLLDMDPIVAPDMAIMFYYYYTHSRKVGRQEFADSGTTGYGGVLEELIAEIPTKGTARLARKLSVDANDIIPRFVRDSRVKERLIAAAEFVAEKYDIPIYRLPDGTLAKTRPPPPPPPKPFLTRLAKGLFAPRRKVQQRPEDTNVEAPRSAEPLATS